MEKSGGCIGPWKAPVGASYDGYECVMDHSHKPMSPLAGVGDRPGVTEWLPCGCSI